MLSRSSTPAIVLAILIVSTFAHGQSPSKNVVSILGCLDEAPTVELKGRTYVDVQDLARITAGSISFKGQRVILVLPRCSESKPSDEASAAASGFSREFKIASIEAMASIREWGGVLQTTIHYGLSIDKTVAGDTLTLVSGHAADKLAIAQASVSTDDDRSGLELLKNEFNNVKAWSDSYIKARNSQQAAAKTMSSAALDEDQDVQKMIHCGQFLAQIFAAGAFQDETSCH
jgi:hypothetical protein